jgi:hypothetical protein
MEAAPESPIQNKTGARPVNRGTGSGFEPEPVPGPLILNCDVPIFLEPIPPNEGDTD